MYYDEDLLSIIHLCNRLTYRRAFPTDTTLNESAIEALHIVCTIHLPSASGFCFLLILTEEIGSVVFVWDFVLLYIILQIIHDSIFKALICDMVHKI